MFVKKNYDNVKSSSDFGLVVSEWGIRMYDFVCFKRSVMNFNPDFLLIFV